VELSIVFKQIFEPKKIDELCRRRGMDVEMEAEERGYDEAYPADDWRWS
jgi:hypothetical protein